MGCSNGVRAPIRAALNGAASAIRLRAAPAAPEPSPNRGLRGDSGGGCQCKKKVGGFAWCSTTKTLFSPLPLHAKTPPLPRMGNRHADPADRRMDRDARSYVRRDHGVAGRSGPLRSRMVSSRDVPATATSPDQLFAWLEGRLGTWDAKLSEAANLAASVEAQLAEARSRGWALARPVPASRDLVQREVSPEATS